MNRREQAILCAKQILNPSSDLDWLKPLAEEFLEVVETLRLRGPSGQEMYDDKGDVSDD